MWNLWFHNTKILDLMIYIERYETKTPYYSMCSIINAQAITSALRWQSNDFQAALMQTYTISNILWRRTWYLLLHLLSNDLISRVVEIIQICFIISEIKKYSKQFKKVEVILRSPTTKLLLLPCYGTTCVNEVSLYFLKER